MAGLPHIFSPVIASLLLGYINDNTKHLVYVSKHLTYAYPDRILARTMIAEEHPLRAFQCFEPEVYYGMISAIFTMSLIITIQQQKVKTFFTSFWSFLSVILSDYYCVPVKKAIERQLSSSWLISCTILLAAFSGGLRDQVIKGKAIYWIDNVKDLYHSKQISKIHLIMLTDLSNFIKNHKNSNPMAKDFSQRDLQEYNPAMGKKLEDTIDFEAMKRGTAAMVYPAHFIEIFKNKMESDKFREDIDFHVSSNNGYSSPLFTVTNRVTLEDKYSLIWDKV